MAPSAPGGRAEVLLHKVHPVHGEGPAPQVFQRPRAGGEGEGELIGVQGLEGAAVPLVVPLAAVLAVPQQGVPGGGELGPDLVGPPGEQLALHQGEAAAHPQGPV